jgi:23S rRNA (uridine2552-2'-O)-methyltransferase
MGLVQSPGQVPRRLRSSAAWLRRQADDPFVAEAKRRGLRSRAALKLEEIDAKLKLLRPGRIVVDLGASPGSWSQVASARVGPTGRVVAADILEIEPLDGVSMLQLDLRSDDATGRIRALLEQRRAHVMLNDMAPNTSGIAVVDHLRSIALCEVGLAIAHAVLLPGGALLSKVFMGGGELELRASLQRSFERVRVIKPRSSRQESRELYIAALGFKPCEE